MRSIWHRAMKTYVWPCLALCAAMMPFLAVEPLGQEASRLEQALAQAVTKACGALPTAATEAFATVDALRERMDCTVGVIAYLRLEADTTCGSASERDTATRAQRRARCAERAMQRAAGRPIPSSATVPKRNAQMDAAARLLLEDKGAAPVDNAVTITGRQYDWTVRYVLGSKRCTLSKVLVLPYGKRTRLSVTSYDIIHVLSVPDLGIKIDAVPGRLNTIVIEGSAVGRYSGVPSTTSGSSGRNMTVEVEVKSADAYAAWERETLTGQTCENSP
jgi:heme/copper-type cytochrome/quinol oxidase subunit 2